MPSMRAPGSYLWLASVVLLLAFTVLAVEETESTDNDDAQTLHMFPLTKRDLEDAFGLRKRSDEIDLTSLNLASQHELFFGGLSDNDQIVLANMTLEAPKGQRMVLMEHFEELTSDRICHEDTGHMTLTFNSREAFKHALESWSHIKGDANEQFIMIANHDGCGPDYERQPYIITDIDHHEERMETRLTARSVSFPDTFETYHIRFGDALPTKHFAHKLFKRFVDSPDGVVDDTKAAMSKALRLAREGAKNAVSTVIGDIDRTETMRFGMNWGTPNELKNIFMDMLHKPSRIIINCLDCFVRGFIEMTGSIEVKDGSVKDISITMEPKDFRLKLEIESRLIFVRVKWDWIIETFIVHKIKIPKARINIPNFFTLQPFFSWTAQFVPLGIGVANYTAGVEVTIPDDAKWTLGYPMGPVGSGFEGTTVDTHFNVRQADGICKVVIGSTPKITAELEVMKVGKLQSMVVLSYPEYGLDISPRIDKGGACEKELGAGTAGASLNGVLDITINIVTATFWRNKPLEITDWRIYFDRKPLPQLCYAFPAERFEVGDSPSWLTETGFDSQEDGLPTELDWGEDGLPAEFTSATNGGEANENADERGSAVSGSPAAAPRLRSRSLDAFRLDKARRRSRELIE